MSISIFICCEENIFNLYKKTAKGGCVVTNDHLMIGFCCAVMHKEPIKPIVDSLVQRLIPREKWRMLVYHCFEDLYYDTLPNKGAASIYEMINYDMLDVMVLMPCCDGQLEIYQRVAERCIQHNVPPEY